MTAGWVSSLLSKSTHGNVNVDSAFCFVFSNEVYVSQIFRAKRVAVLVLFEQNLHCLLLRL